VRLCSVHISRDSFSEWLDGDHGFEKVIGIGDTFYLQSSGKERLTLSLWRVIHVCHVLDGPIGPELLPTYVRSGMKLRVSDTDAECL
jgi:hypothetical protein